MKLMELFSVPSAEDDEDKEFDKDVDYADDLKFWIDTNDKMLSNYIFPAIKNHSDMPNHPEAFTYYIKPLQKCAEEYCREFKLSDHKDEIFGKDEIKKIAEKFADEQAKHIKKGNYKHETD